MKVIYSPEHSSSICPFYITNTHPAVHHITASLLISKTPWSAQTPEIILNGQLLGSRTSYGLRTNPQASPAPLDMPLGVEALTAANETTRMFANAQAKNELNATQPDLNILSAYSGGGSLGESVNEYYTPQIVADAMWLAAGPLPKKARVLDPACGIGNLLARAPEGTFLTGVEMNPTSAAIAKHLLPHADIVNLPFESFQTACDDPFYDVVILNPPFGPRDARHIDEPNEHRNEYYFLKKAIQRVKYQTGIVVALVNLNIAGEVNHAPLRDFIQTYGTVINTIAVPEEAFRAAGAGVSTVILTIRRHDYGVAEALSTLRPKERELIVSEHLSDNLKQWVNGTMVYERITPKNAVPDAEPEYRLKNHFHEHRVLSSSGKISAGRFGQPKLTGTISLSEYRTDRISKEIKQLLKTTAISLPRVLEQIRHHYGPNSFEQAQTAAQNASYQPIPLGTYSPDRTWVMTLKGWEPVNEFTNPEISDALQLAVTLQNALKRHYAGENAEQQLKLCQKLDQAYREKHGTYPKRLSSLAGRFPTFGLLLGHLKNGRLELPITVHARLDVQGTPEEVAAQLADLMQLTEEKLSDYANISQNESETLLENHYCFTGELWLAPELYYAGNAYTRSEHARTLANQFTGHRQRALKRQATEFLARIKPVSNLDDLRISPRDHIVPTAVLEAWVNFQLDSIRDGEHLINVERISSTIKFTLKTAQNTEMIHAVNSFSQDEARKLQDFLNWQTKLDRIENAQDMDPDDYRAERAAAMEEATDFETRTTTSFQAWLNSSPFVQEVLSAYNKAKRSYLKPTGLTNPLPIEWHGPALHPYQNADARILATQEGGCAGYGVGVGKTFLGLATTAYLLKLGLVQRPVIVCPSGLVANWMTNARLALPHLKVSSIGMTQLFNADGTPKQKTCLDGSPMFDERGNPVFDWKEDSAAVRQKKLGELAAGETDITIMSREVFTSIPLSEETLDYLISTDLQINARLESKENYDPQGRKGRHDTLKRITEFRAAASARVKRARYADLPFETLGIDCTVLDESQAYKNLTSAPTLYGTAIKFIGGGAESNRAMDAHYKNRYIRERLGRTYSLTASWVKNSPLEIHTSINLISDILPSLGLPTVEAMQEQYLRVEPRIITNLEGDLDVRPAAVGFRRLKELKSVIDSRIIVRHPGDPEVILSNGEPMHVPRVQEIEYPIEMTPAQAEYYQTLRVQASQSAGQGKGENHTFSVMWRMRKTTLDPAIMGISGPNPRFEAIADIALKERAEGGKVLVFMSIGEKDGSFERLKQVLIRKGFPAHEIEIVTSMSHKSSVARQDLEDRYNYGGLRCLLLSTVAEEGFNLQIGTSAVIHGDCPWNFQSLNQRIGRAARQGNALKVVRSYHVLLKGSFDVLTFTILKGKKAWEDQLDGEHDEVENTAADFNADEIALLLAPDPDAMRERIAEKKAELAERSGRAAGKRRIENLVRTLNAKQGLKHSITMANSRKHGWTALDYMRVNNAKRAYERANAQLSTETTFTLGKLLHYIDPIEWRYGVPFHIGMTFTMEEVQYEIADLGLNDLKIKNLTSQPHTYSTLTYHQIARQGHQFSPTNDPDMYDDQPVTQGIQALNIQWPQDAPITVLDGRNIDPSTRTEGVLTIGIRDNKVEALSGATAEYLRAQISLGKTVIHFLTETNETTKQIRIQHVAVLCHNDNEYQRTLKVANHPAFADRLQQIMKHAIAS